MKFIRALKPTLWKVIISVVLTSVWVMLNQFWSRSMMCKLCPLMPVGCYDLNKFLIANYCSCSCTTLLRIFEQYLYFIIFPLVGVYLIYSVFQFYLNKNKKK